MAAGKYSFSIEQGASFTKTFTVKQPDGSPLNLAAYKVRMMARASYDDAAPIITLSTIEPPGGITISNPGGGQFQVVMSAAFTAALKFSRIMYDLEIESGEGLVTRLLEGTVTLLPEVTK